jgi:hypothetical protein
VSDLSDVVSITVSTQNPGVTQAGFGVPAIVSHSAAWAERSRSYADLSEVASDFATTTVEYLAASQIFAQSPTVEEMKILRASGKPTQRYAIGVAPTSAPAPVVGAVYAAKIKTAGQDYQTASYTAVGAAAWAALTAYATGYLLLADTDKFYICVTAGTSSAATPPTGTGAAIVDGTVTWMYAGAGVVSTASNDAILYNLKEAIDALASPAVSGVGATLVTTSLQAQDPAHHQHGGPVVGVQITSPPCSPCRIANIPAGATIRRLRPSRSDNDWYGLLTLTSLVRRRRGAGGQQLYRAASLDWRSGRLRDDVAAGGRVAPEI